MHADTAQVRDPRPNSWEGQGVIPGRGQGVRPPLAPLPLQRGSPAVRGAG
jgi:hypothetical protein